MENNHKRKFQSSLSPNLMIIKVARDWDLAQQIGRDFYFDLVDHDKVRHFHIQEDTPFFVFKEETAKEFGVPVQFQRFWFWAERPNDTYRPEQPLTPQEEAQSVGQLSENNEELELFLEVELGTDLRPNPLPEKTTEDLLLFFKLYDPEIEELRYVGRLFVKSFGKPIEILEKLNQMAGFAPDEDIALYKELSSDLCILLDKMTSFQLSEIEDGDIVCIQKALLPERKKSCLYPDVPNFLENVPTFKVVHFRSTEKPNEDDFSLRLSEKHSYDDVVEKVSRRINLDDPSKIRLTSHNCYTQQPNLQPIKYQGVKHLSDMLIYSEQISDILYYEVLDIPLPEVQRFKDLKVYFHHATMDEVVIHCIRLPKQCPVGDAINVLKTKVELSHPNAELRLLEIFYHKIYKIFQSNENIEIVNDQNWTLRLEEIPEEEKNLGAHDRLIHVYHFTKESAQNQKVQNFGEPFFLVIHEGETLAEIKLRVQKKLLVSHEEFAKWKFAFLSLGQLEYLQNTDVVFTRFQRRDGYTYWDQYLGLEHSYNASKKLFVLNQVPNASTIPENGTSIKPGVCFDKMVTPLLEMLEDDKAPCSLRLSDFNDIASNRSVSVGIFTVPQSLESYAKDLLASCADVGTGNSPVHYINEMVFVVLCNALKGMDTTRFTEITESLILKWRDAIRGALHSGFKVDFLKDHLKTVAVALLAKLARNS